MAASASHRSSQTTGNSPTLLWWQDAASRRDFEIHRAVLASIASEGGPGLLLGFQSFTPPDQYEVHAWDYKPLPDARPDEMPDRILRALASGPPAGLSAVGLATPLSWTASDAAAVIAALRQSVLPEGVLVLQRKKQGQVQALFWDSGAVELRATALEFPVLWSELAKRDFQPFQPLYVGKQPHEEAPLEKPAPVTVEPPAPVTVEPPAPRRRRRWTWAIPVVVLFAVAMAGAGWYVTTRQNAHPEAPPRPSFGHAPRLGFDVKRAADGGLDIRWDPDAARYLAAQSAHMQIVDGGQEQRLALSTVEMNSGKLIYVPRSGNVELVLTFQTPSGPVQEGMRVIHATDIARQPVPTRMVVPGPEMERTRAETAARQFEPPRAAPRAPELGTAPAPDVALVVPSGHPLPALDLSRTVAPQPSAARPPEAAGMMRGDRAVVPPRPLRQVAPAVPAHLKPMLPAETVVTVRLQLDAQGRVTAASADGGSGVLGHLSRLAEAAGRQWRFAPATLDGKPVPAQHVIHFRFGR